MIDRHTINPGMLIRWTGESGDPNKAFRYAPIMNLFPCRMHDSLTLKPLDTLGIPAYQCTMQSKKGDLFTFLGMHPTRPSCWKLYCYRLKENVWVLNRAFWKCADLVTDVDVDG